MATAVAKQEKKELRKVQNSLSVINKPESKERKKFSFTPLRGRSEFCSLDIKSQIKFPGLFSRIFSTTKTFSQRAFCEQRIFFKDRDCPRLKNLFFL